MGVLDKVATANAITAAGMDAVYYMTKDFQRARKFYETALGLKPAWEMSGDGTEWVEYGLSDGSTFGLGYMPDTEVHASGGIMFAVSDVQKAVEQAKQAGATATFDLVDLPNCTMAWFIDTEGNSFGLHHRKDGTVG
jgi:predicted enzyme related to lactoylglutathione lyase